MSKNPLFHLGQILGAAGVADAWAHISVINDDSQSLGGFGEAQDVVRIHVQCAPARRKMSALRREAQDVLEDARQFVESDARGPRVRPGTNQIISRRLSRGAA